MLLSLNVRIFKNAMKVNLVRMEECMFKQEILCVINCIGNIFFLQKLNVARLIKKLPALYEVQEITVVIKRAFKFPFKSKALYDMVTLTFYDVSLDLFPASEL
jgi:hypothetical protein